MSRAMIQAAATMNQLQHKLDLIGHNMANSQTTGYKARQSEFSSLLFQQINNLNAPENAEGRVTPDGLRVGSGARLGSIQNNLAIGSFIRTDRSLDVALQDESYLFQIQTEENGVQETRYTRDGTFHLSPMNNNQDLMLTTGDGHPVLGQNGPIVIPNGFESLDIRDNGQVFVERNGQTEFVGELAIVEVIRPHLLEESGDNFFRLPDGELGFNIDEIIQPLGLQDNAVKSGVLEHSNVDVAKEMSDLIIAQRSYQFNARTISQADQMMGLVNQLRS